MKLAIIDFETGAIEKRPVYPPPPVGFAEKVGTKVKYWSWGHPTGNNCTKAQARARLKELFLDYTCIFHNAAFDISVAINHMQCKFPAKYHDTLFLAYLFDPREPTLSLKPLSELYLDMPPEEQDRLKNWILANVAQCKNTKYDPWGKYIFLAPGRLVGQYAKGDVIRTEKLFNFYYPKIIDMGMREAYERELKVMPIFESMSAAGIRVDQRKLKKDISEFEKHRLDIGNKVRRKLRASKELNIDSDKQLADALEASGKMDRWILTEKGNRSTSKENLLSCCNDKNLVGLLSRYSVLGTYLNTFMKPWYETASNFDSRIYPNFNQVRSPDEFGNRMFGTRTGRPSSNNPNLLNVPRNLDSREKWAEGLPFMRSYIKPDEGLILNSRDYSQQEIRMLAHFEDDILMQAYIKNPTMDVHDFAQNLIKKITGILLPRKAVKMIAFGIIYGMGSRSLSSKLDVTEEMAKSFKNAYLKSFPGIKVLNRELKLNAQNGESIRTWGGRLYEVEEPKLINGKRRTFEYKLLNYLIQGSSADVTKQAMINVSEACNDSRIMLQVYDEILCSSGSAKEMKLIKQAMEDIKLDVPLLSDGKTGRRNWAELKECK